MNWLLQLLRIDKTFGGRHKDWGKLRKRHISVYPKCSVCGKKKLFISNIPHHILPVYLFPEKEMDLDNLITLCSIHHLWWGHLGYFKSFNKNVIIDSKYWHNKIINRP